MPVCVGVLVGVAVLLGVAVDVLVGVEVGVFVPVWVGVAVAVLVAVPVWVGVFRGSGGTTKTGRQEFSAGRLVTQVADLACDWRREPFASNRRLIRRRCPCRAH